MPKTECSCACLPNDWPQPWLEKSAGAAPLWARLTALYLRLLPGRGGVKISRLLRRCLPAGPSLFSIRHTTGFRWLVDMAKLPQYCVESPLAAEGAEASLVAAIEKMLRLGDFVIDIGANRGFFSLLSWRLTGPGGRVVAVEPVPMTTQFLAANLRLNGADEVAIFPFAASDENGEAVIHFHPANLALSTLHSNDFLAASDGTQDVTIQLRRLDDFLEDPPANAPVVLKLDVEGHEIHALKGAARLVAQRQPLILVEAKTVAARRSIIEYLQSLAPYSFAAISIRVGLIIPLDGADDAALGTVDSYDMVAWIPEIHGDRISGFVKIDSHAH